jgi:hypothetical protein
MADFRPSEAWMPMRAYRDCIYGESEISHSIFWLLIMRNYQVLHTLLGK